MIAHVISIASGKIYLEKMSYNGFKVLDALKGQKRHSSFHILLYKSIEIDFEMRRCVQWVAVDLEIQLTYFMSKDLVSTLASKQNLHVLKSL